MDLARVHLPRSGKNESTSEACEQGVLGKGGFSQFFASYSQWPGRSIAGRLIGFIHNDERCDTAVAEMVIRAETATLTDLL